MAGIYLHIPFCKQACTYCDFHFSTHLADKEKLVAAMCGEIDQRYSYLPVREISSIYLGGGTPSLLTRHELSLLLQHLSAHFRWTKDAEITLEANPDDINNASLKEWLQCGINRLSIGLQSFNESELRWMNRAHTAAESEASVKRAQDAGFGNITIDLIYGSKFQTLDSWQETLEKATELNTQHISSYNLTIEKSTVLGHRHGKGSEPAVDDEASSNQMRLMMDFLRSRGYEHYEISNFAKPGFIARHNSNYWLQQPYLGIGPSAHSFDLKSRQWNVSSNKGYIQAISGGKPYYQKEELSNKDLYNEYVLTRLRTTWGCNIDEIGQKFGQKAFDHFMMMTAKHESCLETREGTILLNKEGKMLADRIASDLFLL